MNLHSGYFPPHGYRRKQATTASAYHVPLNNQQQHQHGSSLQSARTSVESNNGNDSFLPSISKLVGNSDGHRPYRRNDFANNHLFLAKRKLARVFLGEPTRSLQANSDLIHLFDQQEPKRKHRTINKVHRQESLTNPVSSLEQDVHLSVVNLTMKHPYPSPQTRDPLSSVLQHRRSQAISLPSKVSRSLIETVSPPNKQNFQSTSLHTFTDEHDPDGLTDYDNVLDTIVIDVYQEWAGPTVILEDMFLKLKRTLSSTVSLTFHSANCENIEALRRYRGYCEPLLLYFASNMLVHVQQQMNAPMIEKTIEEQLHLELQVNKGNRKRDPIDESYLTKYSENSHTQATLGNNTKKSLAHESTLYRDESASLRSLLMRTAEKIDQDYWLHSEPYKLGVSLLVIKPDLVANGKTEEILDLLREKGFLIHTNTDKLLSHEDVIKIFKPELNILDEFTRFMSSGPSNYAIVSKGYTGRSTSDDLRYVIGPNEPDLAKENHPQSLTALYGTDSILNGFYSSSTNHDALKEIQMIFPEYHQPVVEGKSAKEYIQKTSTLCILGPVQVRLKKDAIIQAILERGFEVRYRKVHRFRPDEVESLYIQHHNDGFFPALIEAYTAGPSLLLYVAKEDCVSDFYEFLGPFSREKFSQMPGTLRHDFDDPTILVTTIHGSTSIVDARKELEQFFPFQQTLAIMKPGLSPSQKDEVLKRLNSNGFMIMTKEARRLTKDVLIQFYARHQGLPWFNDFIQFMGSDVCELLVLAREDAVQALRAIMGPVDPVRAKTDAPESIRAIFGLDIMRNGFHASSNNKHARAEIRLLFPDYEFIKARPLPFQSNSSSIDAVIINELSTEQETDDLYHLESDELIYKFAVHTRSNETENDESAVFLTLIGKEQETSKCLLQFPENTLHPLQSNQTDFFNFVDQDIGIPKLVKFSHDGRGFPKNWFLTNIEVTIPYRKKAFRFNIDQIIDEENAQLGFPVTEIEDIERTTHGNCAIIIQTGYAKYAGTSADCSVLLSGSKGLYAFPLRHSLTNRVAFRNRFRDIFLVQIDEEFQQLEYIVLEHNNENSAPAWFVDFVVIKLLTSQQEYFFPVHRWLSMDYFDGKTRIILSPNTEKISSNENLLEQRSNVIRYEIRLVTGSMVVAGTSAPVWITINGSRGAILNKYLEIAENEWFPFEPNNEDVFIVYDIDIGEIEKLILGHENISAEQGWFVQSISIHIPSKQYQSETFLIKKWLNSKRSDGVPLVEIQVRKPFKLQRKIKNQPSVIPKPVSQTSVAIYEPSYTIYILTEEFQSDVNKPSLFIDLIDNETSSTNYMRLTSHLPVRENLGNNVLGMFVAHGTKIEKISSIRLLIRTPDQITRWLPRFILIIIDHSQRIYQCENSTSLHSTSRDHFQSSTIELSSTELNSPINDSNERLQLSPEDVENIAVISNEPLEKIKQLYTNITGKTVIDKRD